MTKAVHRRGKGNAAEELPSDPPSDQAAGMKAKQDHCYSEASPAAAFLAHREARKFNLSGSTLF